MEHRLNITTCHKLLVVEDVFCFFSNVPFLLNLQGVFCFFFSNKKRKERKCLADKTVIFPLEEVDTGEAGKGER